ncbi:MAG: tRNA (adenosine(37)-N6)-threonylcarbamoyltransferase complex dimerization subunit type 1 TsaB [Ignavibacteria bacterium]|nr:tRNA (adenosine(37)-N6)-threonylcarbamoyltransferase complex dimerization subunit type 1 TsaB [Ignavibacteria bacterium]
MNILVLDTSNYNPEFAFFENKRIIVQKKLYSDNNADSLIYGIIEGFKESGRKMKNIEILALSKGPGSFTGLRVGSAAAKGICTASGCRFIELNSLDIIAEKFRLNFAKECIAAALIPMNSRTNEFYYAFYEICKENIKRIGKYLISGFKQINFGKKVLLINDKVKGLYVRQNLTDLSEYCSADAMYSLAQLRINGNEYNDFRNSEPNYMKDFVPLKKKF